MSLIDKTFFVKKLNIPNTGTPEVDEIVDSYIKQYEPQFLLKLMGYPLYKAFIAAPAEDRFKAIIDGEEYTDLNGMMNKWPGLVVTISDSTPVQKQCIIANYVYYKYRAENATQFTGIGEAIIGGENATMVNPRKKMALVWNEMSDQVKQLLQFLDSKQDLYPEWNNIYKVEALKSFGFLNPFF